MITNGYLENVIISSFYYQTIAIRYLMNRNFLIKTNEAKEFELKFYLKISLGFKDSNLWEFVLMGSTFIYLLKYSNYRFTSAQFEFEIKIGKKIEPKILFFYHPWAFVGVDGYLRCIIPVCLKMHEWKCTTYYNDILSYKFVP